MIHRDGIINELFLTHDIPYNNKFNINITELIEPTNIP